MLDKLNPEQKKAVTAGDGQVLIIAGAGSGKTSVLAHRVAYLIREKKAAPWQILALTFTNKAAREMRQRIENLLNEPTGGLWMGTFHSICLRILRMEVKHTSMQPDFLVYDQDDCRSICKKLIKAAGIEDKKLTPQALLSLISDAKNKLVSPAQMQSDADNHWHRTIAALYKSYQEQLRLNNALDFDDLLSQTQQLLAANQEICLKYAKRFRYILVDEYQDTNRCQYQLIRLLAGENGNLFVVGDPDQSIYGWRGADIRNILDFEKDYPQAQVIKLVRNYRSTKTILDAANALIANNSQRKPKDLVTEAECGEKLLFYTAGDDREEANFILRNICRWSEKGYKYSDCAVLYRTHAQSRLLEEQCLRLGVAYRVFGGQRFYERMEIKDSLAYLRVVANPADGESLTRIYNRPKRGLGATTWEKLAAFAACEQIPLMSALARLGEIDTINDKTKAKLYDLYQSFAKWRKQAQEGLPLTDLLNNIWLDSGYFESMKSEADGEERVANLEQLYNIADDFDKNGAIIEQDEDQPPLIMFLSQLALATDFDDTASVDNYLTMMTLHAAKGLEFPIVFMAGMEENLFPGRRSGSEDEMEEERRLCYVGMTRAEKKLVLTAAARRMVWGQYNYNQPSRFIKEIPQDLLQLAGLSAEAVKPAETTTKDIFKTKAPAPIIGEKTRFVPGELPRPNAVGSSGFKLGQKVAHSKFGVGVIVAVSGVEGDQILRIAFPNLGIKELSEKYAPLKKL
ncbi:MAG: UvrD-helicase domain-containing protein [Clostridia bacterium]|nr:UvrD-helicase domain-containing protein [Clostridia bacterium]